MSDTLDLVTEHVDLLMQARVQTVKNSLTTRQFLPRGHCHYCKEPVLDGQVYCDEDCATDHNDELEAAIRNHGSHQC